MNHFSSHIWNNISRKPTKIKDRRRIRSHRKTNQMQKSPKSCKKKIRGKNQLKAKQIYTHQYRYFCLSPNSSNLGFISEVATVDSAVLRSLVNIEQIPVVSSIAADESGQPYKIWRSDPSLPCPEKVTEKLKIKRTSNVFLSERGEKGTISFTFAVVPLSPAILHPRRC